MSLLPSDWEGDVASTPRASSTSSDSLFVTYPRHHNMADASAHGVENTEDRRPHKRRRGRPRKDSLLGPPPPKNPRGRPRKNQLPYPAPGPQLNVPQPNFSIPQSAPDHKHGNLASFPPHTATSRQSYEHPREMFAPDTKPQDPALLGKATSYSKPARGPARVYIDLSGDVPDRKPPPAPKVSRGPNFDNAIFGKGNSPLVIFSVSSGSNAKDFRAHRDAVTAVSPVFRGHIERLPHPTSDGEFKVLLVPQVEPVIFSIFINWIYCPENDLRESEEPNRTLEIMELAKLWVQAGIWKIPLLQDRALEVLYEALFSPILEPPVPGRTTEIRTFLEFAYGRDDDAKALRLLGAARLLCFIPRGRTNKELPRMRTWLDSLPEGVLLEYANMTTKYISSQDVPKRYPIAELFLVTPRP